MTLGAPQWLHLLWLLPPVVGLLVWAARARQRGVQALIGAGLLARELPPDLERRRAWAATLALLGLAAVALAAAQPRWGFTWVERPLRGVEVVLLLDVSRSMDARDVEPSRLERARREASDLLDRLSGDRVGLVVFAAGAYPRVPLTLDHRALRGILAQTDTTLLQAQGSNLGGAVREALALFGPAGDADRAIIVLSDGEAWDSATAEAAQEAAAQGVRLYTIAIGGEDGAPIPEPGGGFKLDRTGRVVLSRVNEEALRGLAQATGGAAVRSVAGAADANALVAELRAALTRTTEERRAERVWDERFQWPLAAGLGLLLLSRGLGDRRAALSLALLLLALPARANPAAEARTLLAQGRHQEAVALLAQAQVDQPGDVGLAFALAEALYRAGRYEEAARAYEQLAARAPEPGQRRDAGYNAGLAAYQAGRLDDAVAAWQQVLEQDPEHAAARHNAEQVQQEIAARLQPPPPQQGEEQPQDGEAGDPPQEGEDGAAQPQPGQPAGQPPSAAPDPRQQAPQARPEDAAPPSDGTRPEAPEGGTRAGEGAPQGEASPEGQADPLEGGGGVGEMSPQEALRVLEGVEEGQPRVVIRGQAQEKDW